MNKYYDLKDLLHTNSKYNMIIGERSNGKSYQVKLHCLKKALKGISQFAYVRREREDVKRNAVEEYFSDINIVKLSHGKYDCIQAYSERIYACHHEDDKIIKDIVIGHYFYLSGETHYKSRAYPNTEDLIFEEFITDSGYLYEEPKTFMSLCSTIFRQRENVSIWMIGNTISQNCPYFNAWHLNHVYKQEIGTIETYLMDDVVSLAIEYTGSIEKKETIFFGQSKQMIQHGKWDTSSHQHISERDTYNHYYDIYFRFNGMIWYRMELLQRDNNKPILFVHPYTKEFQKDKEYRIIDSDTFNEESRLVTKTFEDVTIYDPLVKDIISKDNIVFSDDITGDNYYTHKKEGGFR